MSGDDLSGTTNARLSRLEAKYDELSRAVSSAVMTIDRVETNQKHAEELSKVRFGALDLSVGLVATNTNTIGSKLDSFITRFEGLMTGEVQTTQIRKYIEWQDGMEKFRDDQAVRNGRIDLIAKLVYGLVGGNIVAIISAIIFLAMGNHL